jgi:ketosteroid isomerase-like protein
MSQQNLETVRKGYEAFGRGDLDTLLGLFDENIEWVTPGPSDFPLAGTRRGRQQVADFFGVLDGVLEIQEFAPKTFLADGDKVVVLGVDTSRVKASGTVISSDWAHVYTFKGGKIVAFQEYTDTAATVAALRGAHVTA